jgi:hypothetical protein
VSAPAENCDAADVSPTPDASAVSSFEVPGGDAAGARGAEEARRCRGPAPAPKLLLDPLEPLNLSLEPSNRSLEPLPDLSLAVEESRECRPGGAIMQCYIWVSGSAGLAGGIRKYWVGGLGWWVRELAQYTPSTYLAYRVASPLT